MRRRKFRCREEKSHRDSGSVCTLLLSSLAKFILEYLWYTLCYTGIQKFSSQFGLSSCRNSDLDLLNSPAGLSHILIVFSSPPARHSDLDTPSQQQARISASCATRELDELMASLSDFKVRSSQRKKLEASLYLHVSSSAVDSLSSSSYPASASLSCSPALWALCWSRQSPPPALLILQSLPPSPPWLLLSFCPTRLPVPLLSSLCLPV